MPITDRIGESKPESDCPGQELSCSFAAVWLPAARGDLVLQAAVPADPVQAQQRERQQRGDDHEELEDLVVDRGRQPAEGDVGQHDEGGEDQGHPERPAEQRDHDAAEQVEVDPGDEQLRHRERDRVDQVRAGAEAAPHELGDRAHLGAVVERHHDDAEEEHRRDRADPEVVHGRQADLGAGGGHAHDLDGPEVGRHEGQPGDPGRQRATREEEVDRVRDPPTGHQPDREDESEVDRDDQVVDEVRLDERVARQHGDARGAPSHAPGLSRDVTADPP